MIAFLSGKIVLLTEKYVILDVNNIGYRVYISNKTHTILAERANKVNQRAVRFFTHLVVNSHEGQLDMYGFLDPEELSLFELLISVSGIGPKNALNVISNVDPAKLQAAIIKGDAEYLHKVGGLGPKTAERLVLELKGKFKAAGRKVNLSAESEALDALVSLGYNRSQALEALGKVKGGAGTEAKVKEALKLLSGR